MSKIIKPSNEKLFGSVRKFEKRQLVIEPKMKPVAKDREKPSAPTPTTETAPEYTPKQTHLKDLLEDARREAGDILNKALLEAERTIREAESKAKQTMDQAEKALLEAKREADDIRRKAREKGRTEGVKEGRRDSEEHMKALSKMLDSFITRMSAREAERSQLLTPLLANLAIELAQKIIHREIEEDVSLVASQAEKAISKIVEREELVIRVNPMDEDLMKNHKTKLKEMFDGIEKIEVIGDPDIERGGCIVETNLVRVDAQPSSQLEAAHRALLGEGGK